MTIRGTSLVRAGAWTRPATSRIGAVLRRAAGAAIVLLAALPVYGVLADPATGRAGWVTRQLVGVFADFAWSGTLLVFAAALAASRFLPPRAAERFALGVMRRLSEPSTLAFAITAAAVAMLLTAVFSWAALDGKPNMIDAMAQALHARFIAEGMLAGPATDWNAFWHIQNSVITERGWVSQYPPGHVLLLAAGMALGAPWLVGPLMVGATVFFGALIAERLYAHDVGTARLGTALLALSPFSISIGASYLSHAPTVALLAAAVYCILRARTAVWPWAPLAGVCAGAALTMRPLTTVAIAGGVALAAWLEPKFGWTRALRRTAVLGAAAAAGALPPVALLLAYNAYFFGSATTFGYTVALGPRMGLGFGVDPWGNRYGLLEAIGYTSADLTTLGVALLETPLSAAIVVGLFLLLAPRLARGERVLAAWAIMPVLANAFYWHHGIYMGPRMLYEAAPAWILLFAVASVRAVRAAPHRLARLPAYSPRAAAIAALTCMLVAGLGVLAPQRVATYGGAVRPMPAAAKPEDVAIVFVHDAWGARLSMRLAALGMRLDSIETSLRQNPTCRVQELADAWEREGERAAARVLDRMDLQPRATRLPALVRVMGSAVRIGPGERLTPECTREILADRNGIIDIAPLVWQGDVPGGAERGRLFVRDLGPAANARLIERMPNRRPYVLYTPTEAASAVLQPYELGMRELWGEDLAANLTLDHTPADR